MRVKALVIGRSRDVCRTQGNRVRINPFAARVFHVTWKLSYDSGDVAMELPTGNGRYFRMSVEEFDTEKLMQNAARQRDRANSTIC